MLMGFKSVRAIAYLVLFAVCNLFVLSAYHAHSVETESHSSCAVCIAHQDLAQGVSFAANHPSRVDDFPKIILLNEITAPLNSPVRIQPARAPPFFRA